jgi:voltage-gated potassium channel
MLKSITSHFNYDRDKYDNFLDDENFELWVIINHFITLLVVAFVFMVTFESLWNNAVVYASEIFFFDAFISTIFAVEYIYRFLRARDKKVFLLNPVRFVDFLSFIPFFIWLVSFGEFVVVLKLIRVLRILRLVKRIPLTSWFIKSLKFYIDEYKAVFLLFLVALFLWTFFVYYAEKDLVWTKFTSIPISLWWGIVTMTTVWYGDMYPITPLGKLFWSLMVFLWPVLLALSSAVTIMVFTETNNSHKMTKKITRLKICSRCDSRNIKEANYCITCWKKLLWT